MKVGRVHRRVHGIELQVRVSEPGGGQAVPLQLRRLQPRFQRRSGAFSGSCLLQFPGPQRLYALAVQVALLDADLAPWHTGPEVRFLVRSV
jgi:hypothetical protein